MCMRQAPALVRQQEKLEEEEAERLRERSTLDAPNVSFEMYSELEAFPGLGLGCQLLAEMVRSHAVLMIREAIDGGCFSVPVSATMVTIAAHWQCLDEAAGLLESMLTYHLGHGQNRGALEDSQVCEEVLQFVDGFCHHPRQRNMVYEVLARLLLEGNISGDWLLRKGSLFLWRALIRSLATEVSCPGASAFAAAALASLSNMSTSEPPSLPPPEQRLIQVLSATAAIGYLTEKPSMRSRVLFILDQALAAWWKKGTLSNNTPAHLLAMATIMASKGSSSTALKLMDSSHAGDKQYHAVASLVSGVARLCGRDSTQPSHGFLATICDTMSGIRLAGRSITTIKMDGAFLLAQKTCDLRDLSFAESLPGEPQRHGSGGFEAISSETLFSGYRWDEGISEWVVRTPAVKAAGKSKLRKHSSVREAPLSPRRKTRVMPSRLECSEKPNIPTVREMPPPACESRGRRRRPLLSLQANAQGPVRDLTEAREGKGETSRPGRATHQKQRRVVWDIELSSEDDVW